MACMIIITLNRFLNLKYLKNESSFNLFKLAFWKEKSEKYKLTLMDSYLKNSEVVMLFRVFPGNELWDFFCGKMGNNKE